MRPEQAPGWHRQARGQPRGRAFPCKLNNIGQRYGMQSGALRRLVTDTPPPRYGTVPTCCQSKISITAAFGAGFLGIMDIKCRFWCTSTRHDLASLIATENRSDFCDDVRRAFPAEARELSQSCFLDIPRPRITRVSTCRFTGQVKQNRWRSRDDHERFCFCTVLMKRTFSGGF